jgi:hypothetical protein
MVPGGWVDVLGVTACQFIANIRIQHILAVCTCEKRQLFPIKVVLNAWYRVLYSGYGTGEATKTLIPWCGFFKAVTQLVKQGVFIR